MIDTAKYGPWALIAGGSEGVGAEFAWLLAAFADAMNPMGRIGDPYLDIAPVALFLAGEGLPIPHREHVVRRWRQPHQRRGLGA